MNTPTIKPETINILGGSKYPTLESIVTVMGSTCNKVVIYNAADMMIYSGDPKKLISGTGNFYEKIRAMHVTAITTGDVNGAYQFTLEEKENPCLFTTISNFPKKELRLADLLYYFDKKEIIVVLDHDEIVYQDRQEYLEWTCEGTIHPLALRKVSWMEAGNNTICIYLEDEDNE